MGRKKTPGLNKRKNIWYIDKKINGIRLYESTGTHSLEEAERYLAHRIEAIRRSTVYGIRPPRLFRQAATKYLLENQDNRTIEDDAMRLKLLDPYIGDLTLDKVHIHSLQPFIQARKTLGRKTKTINLTLGVVRRILNLASTEWVDENGLTWLETAPKIKMLIIRDQRPSYPLSWEEQDLLFSYLPKHLHVMALFKVNTGTRQQEVCQLEWAWEVPITELNSSVFVVPGYLVKNGENRLIVLNHIAKEIIDKQRGKNNKYVFTYKDNPITRMNNKAWINARSKANLKHVRVHDLKHTFGRRLRAAGVSFEDRQDLLGHRSGRITTHYSSAELQNILNAANKACDRKVQGLALFTLKQSMQNNVIKFPSSRKSHAPDSVVNSEPKKLKR